MKVTLLHLQELSKSSLQSTKQGGLLLPQRATTTDIHNTREAFHYPTVPQCPPLSVPSCFLNQSLKICSPIYQLDLKTISNGSCTQKTYFFTSLCFLRTKRVSHTLLHSDLVPRLNCVCPLSSSHDFPLFLSFYNKISWVKSPNSWVRSETSRWVLFPFSH
jgi:hypothetical protein